MTIYNNKESASYMICFILGHSSMGQALDNSATIYNKNYQNGVNNKHKVESGLADRLSHKHKR